MPLSMLPEKTGSQRPHRCCLNHQLRCRLLGEKVVNDTVAGYSTLAAGWVLSAVNIAFIMHEMISQLISISSDLLVSKEQSAGSASCFTNNTADCPVTAGFYRATRRTKINSSS